LLVFDANRTWIRLGIASCALRNERLDVGWQLDPSGSLLLTCAERRRRASSAAGGDKAGGD
jgi:hypothetical protein